MEIEGKLIRLLDVTTGKGNNGEWTKQDFILETMEQFPKKVCISVWNNKIDITAVPIGQVIKVSVNVESREYNNKWYTDVRAWKMEAQASMANDMVPPPMMEAPALTPDDDLPF